MDNFKLLRQIPLFADLDDDAVRALAVRARIRAFETDQRIVNQSDSIQAFYIILSGRVKIFRSNSEGKEQILYLIEAGQPFCFCTAFTDKPYPVSVTALEESIVADIPAPAMEDLAQQHPLLMLKIMQTLAGRLLEAMNLVESLSLRCIPQRVASFLLHEEHAAPSPPGQPFTLSISHREMAKILGTTPETLSRTLQKLKKDRLLESSGRTIRILDRDGMLRVD
ncbi:Crp/Fnr family transcriptional regulator [Pseudodesulfovibrio sp.]|uniref:Crp/Fnr family transcriptional regulator n=1 Tax=Pseudodesulfovibrio sp. TaxID=2035812 RepID=UPI00262B5854|nr:Crp/Fnr family transcriptional regulator [Pseudodesulfovibrio sp.]MDD3310573.1 Crp/Fnr family transcriptional regulator [Pseudodesulfovibrio sp.]